MKRNITHHINPIAIILLVACFLTACIDDVEPPQPVTPPDGDDGYITINIVATQSSSRGILDEPGIDGLHENVINSVVLCLWPQAGDRPETTPPVYFQYFQNLDANDVATLRIPLTDALRRQLFESEGDGNPCIAYVAVNVDPGNATTVAELRNLTVNSSFATSKIQQYFTMDGDGSVSLADNRQSASATIGAHRSACKITVAVACDAEITETTGDGDPVVWKSDLNAMRVSLSNGVKTSTLTPRPSDGIAVNDYFDTPSPLPYNFVTASGDDKYPLEQDTPFYTYPNAWTLSPEEKNRTTVTLSVPWSSDGGKTWRTCYYQVPVVPATSTSLVRNTSYHIRLHVGMLGSFTPDIPLEVPDLSYTAADWSTESFNVDIPDYRFLVVEQENYTFSNEDRIEIPFYTSHETEVVAATMTFYRFNYSDEGAKFPVTIDLFSKANTGVYNARFINAEEGNGSTFLRIWHPLKMYQPMKGSAEISLTNNDGPTNLDRPKTQNNADIQKLLAEATSYKQLPDDEFSKVDFTVTVQHSDMKGQPIWKETIHATQYPAIYIDATANNYNRSGGDLSGTGAMASCWVNGNCTNLEVGLTSSTYWMTSIGLKTSNLNWNPNLYILTISKLPSTSTWQIGDPRRQLINNDLENPSMLPENNGTEYPNYYYPNTDFSFKEGAAIEGGRRSLKWYYPTQEGDATKNIIAPKIRICSSYGGTGQGLNRVRARLRGAAFQEMGFPAGRWRMPTLAEVEFIMNLSAQFKIPRLFGSQKSTWYYWCAQGAVAVPPKEDSNQTPYLESSIGNGDFWRARYVYDEWYWGSEMIKQAPPAGQTYPQYPFTWGDAEIIRPKLN